MKIKNTAWFGACLLSGGLLFASEAAQPPAATTTAKPSAESDLVTASRKSKATPKKKSKLSITDKDVKQSKGKLIIVPSSEEPKTEVKAPPGIADRTAIEKAMAELERASKEVARLEAELERHEQDYYKEDNASYRDEIIVQRFNATRRKLDQARLDLAASREARARLEPVARQ